MWANIPLNWGLYLLLANSYKPLYLAVSWCQIKLLKRNQIQDKHAWSRKYFFGGESYLQYISHKVHTQDQLHEFSNFLQHFYNLYHMFNVIKMQNCNKVCVTLCYCLIGFLTYILHIFSFRKKTPLIFQG